MNELRPIAIYLPQFHPIPENDEAWSEGFTEWTNVKKAVPLFEGHYQPHVPHQSVGYYDLRDPEVMVRQAAMAKEYGIYGFAFYHYWFNGKRLLETPLDNMLKTGKPDFPFCYIWANENWTKRWDGRDQEIIIKQDYSFDDDRGHIRFLCTNVFSDKRYITINDKPVFLVYRTELLPDICETAKIWREEVKKQGFKGLYLIRVESFISDINPLDIGFDASMEFAPDFNCLGYTKRISNEAGNCLLCDYPSTVLKMLSKDDRKFPWYRCVFPGWDNTPRRKKGGFAFIDNSPEVFKHFVYRITEYTKIKFTDDNRLFFVNAWNEWGEGCHLETDNRNGKSFLEVLREALSNSYYVNIKEYVSFLEENLKINIDERKELQDLKISYELLNNSGSYKMTRFILKPYRFLKRILKKSSMITGNP